MYLQNPMIATVAHHNRRPHGLPIASSTGSDMSCLACLYLKSHAHRRNRVSWCMALFAHFRSV